MQSLMSQNNLNCKVCGKDFTSLRGLHIHLSRVHDLALKDYYENYYPRLSRLSQKKILFKNYDQYFESEFRDSKEFHEWCDVAKTKEVSEYIKKVYQKRVQIKKSLNGLSHIELELANLPSIDVYKKFFKSYSEFSESLGLKSNFYKNLPADFWTKKIPEDFKIFIDTREQKPIEFNNSQKLKLDFGDYSASSKYYNYTFIDRKSEADFKSTMSGKNFQRFIREIERAREFNSYLFVVVESDIKKITKNNLFSAHKSKMPYIWHNTKKLSQEFQDSCQIIFANNRSGLKKIIPKLLLFGKQLWNVDVQYFLDKKIYEK